MKTTAELVKQVAETISLPLLEEDRFNATSVTLALNNALDEKITPELVHMNSEFLVVRQVFPLKSSTGVAVYPQLRIPIPNRAFARILREIKYLPESKILPTDEINVPQTSIAEFDTLAKTNYGTAPVAFYIQNDTVNLVADKNNQSGSIVLYYYLKPNKLIYSQFPSFYADITNIQSLINNNYSFTFNSFSLTEPSLSQSYLYDIVRKSTGAVVAHNLRGSYLTPNTSMIFTFTNADEINNIKTYQDGNYPVNTLTSGISPELELVLADTSYRSTLPEEWDNLLVYHTCSKILEALGDFEGLAQNEKRIVDLKKRITDAFSSRVKGERKKIIDRRNIANYQKLNQYYTPRISR
jgi:hypothetical protein